MRRIGAVLVFMLALGSMAALSAASPAPFSIGFGVGIPYELPVDWSRSFSYVTTEIFLSPNLTAVLDLGTYPPEFPDLFEGTAGMLVKAWVGPVNAFAGGGFTLQWRHVGSAWGFNPYLTLKGGFQVWVLDSIALVAQFRTHEPLPVQWTFDPEFSLGMTVALGRGRPDPLLYDPATLWLVVGLGVGALIAFLPKQ
ncbi:MAG: hypothetical protein E4H08_00430 [Candidatus Atribacteria bacterium]|jgi:hypothetical protein|nr:MAG: hypothetical protein E4H08_00430 [Candidatus Atribacteria bacterium]